MRMLSEVAEVHRQYGTTATIRLVAAEAKRLVVNQTIRRSYSQAYEDRFALELLGPLRTGFYVDIGCHDPVRLSNTYLLYRMGWSGLVVDAAPDHASRFAAIRPNDSFLQVGVGAETIGPQSFYVHAASALSTFSADQSARYVAQGHPLVDVLQVPIMSLRDIFVQHVGDRPIDFLTIDIEGFDHVALSSNDWEQFRPRIVCIEVEASGEARHATGVSDETHTLLTEHDYTLAGLRGVNAFYRTE
jgi:hypothetical protein